MTASSSKKKTMADYQGHENDKKRGKSNKNNSDDDNDDDYPQMTTRSPFLPTSSLDAVFKKIGDEILLSEALPYLDAVSIVGKKRVCGQWKEKCGVVINNKGRQEKKRFVDKAELQDAVKRYCRGNRDNIEKIAEEYGYPIGKWDVSRVEDFSDVFRCLGSFNENIGAWDIGNATNMRSMFFMATSFNQNLSGWDVSKVTNMRGMFHCARMFRGDLSGWDTSRVTDMGFMFSSARAFNRDLSAWDTSSVTNMSYMFQGAAAFDGDISGWNVSRVKDMDHMFTREDEIKFSRDRLNLIKVNWERQGKRWW